MRRKGNTLGIVCKKELAKIMASSEGIPATQAFDEIERVVRAITSCISSGYGVTIRGFGRIDFYDIEPYSYYDKRLGRQIDVPARRCIRFVQYDKLTQKLGEYQQ